MVTQSYDRLYDAETALWDGAAITSGPNYTTVGGTTKILDLGAAVRTDFDWVVDVTAFDFGTGDEICILRLQGSNDATFASGRKTLWTLELGDTLLHASDTGLDRRLGRYIVPGNNMGITASATFEAGIWTPMRYLAILAGPAGTTPSVAAQSWLAMKQ